MSLLAIVRKLKQVTGPQSYKKRRSAKVELAGMKLSVLRGGTSPIGLIECMDHCCECSSANVVNAYY